MVIFDTFKKDLRDIINITYMKRDNPFELIQGGKPGPADLTPAAKQGNINSRIHNQDKLGPVEKLDLVNDIRENHLQDIRRGIQAATGILVDAQTAEDVFRTTTQLALEESIQIRRELLEDLKHRHPELTNYFSRFESVVRSNKLED